jgi:spore germination cell wall hydrolase CwlJ-like protein
LASERGVKAESLKQWRRLRRRRRLILMAAGGAIILAAIAAAAWFIFLRPGGLSLPQSNTTRLPPAATSAVSPLDLPPPDLLRPIAPEEALKENAARPFSGRPDTAAAPFNLKTDAKSRDRAFECMTQAVYYEAASEGADGQRAVAQIILNRMRHPGYPASVCGVVYQGSDRPTGCQFTFTCDGSLARPPIPSLWTQAQKIASQALAGKVFAQVGHATHYHADYVVPYWADSLDKSVQIGRHIFYRLKGGLGSAGAFSQPYGGSEPAPTLPSTVEVALQALENIEPIIGNQEIDPALQAPTGDLVAPAPPSAPNLVADVTKGTLILDGDRPPLPRQGTTAKPKTTQSCEDSEDSKRLRPISADDMHARGTDGC